MSVLRSLVAASALTVVGCPSPAELPQGYLIRTGDEPGAVPLSKDALLVADNQQHYLYGKPIWVRTALIDKAVKSAVRAPQLDLFGPSVLEWVLDNYSEMRPVLHLGDGLNLSCAHEFDAFLAIMDHAHQDWFMAPGNHDGIYFGSSESQSEWKAVCDGGGGPISQPTFIRRYLTEGLAGRRAATQPKGPAPVDPGRAQFAREFDVSKNAWTYSGAEPHWLGRVAWHLDDRHPYRSFVVQELDATRPGAQTPVKYILLDTSNYDAEPRLLPIPPHVNPGSTGDLTQKQLDVVKEWIEAANAASTTKPFIVLMSHHPFDDLTPRAKRELEKLRLLGNVLLYVSAHTHRGHYIPHPQETSSWLELNVGSTVDWPLEFRNLRLIAAPKESGGFFYLNSELFQVDVDSSIPDAPECDLAWQPQQSDPDYYIDYTRALSTGPSGLAAMIFNSLLQSHKRMLKAAPSDPANPSWPAGTTSDATLEAMIDGTLPLGSSQVDLDKKRNLLIELQRFDRTRKVSDVTRHRDFRLCQAVWASRDDQISARRARPDDRYIAFPPAEKK